MPSHDLLLKRLFSLSFTVRLFSKAPANTTSFIRPNETYWIILFFAMRRFKGLSKQTTHPKFHAYFLEHVSFDLPHRPSFLEKLF